MQGRLFDFGCYVHASSSYQTWVGIAVRVRWDGVEAVEEDGRCCCDSLSETEPLAEMCYGITEPDGGTAQLFICTGIPNVFEARYL